MPEVDQPAPLPLRRHVNRLVAGGLLSTLTIPVGSTIAAYQGDRWPNVVTVASALTAFSLLCLGLALGPTTDDAEVARSGVPASAVVEHAARLPITGTRGGEGPARAQVVRLDLRIEAEGERPTRVRLRRWVGSDRLDELEPGAVLAAKVLPGRPQDPALGLRP